MVTERGWLQKGDGYRKRMATERGWLQEEGEDGYRKGEEVGVQKERGRRWVYRKKGGGAGYARL